MHPGDQIGKETTLYAFNRDWKLFGVDSPEKLAEGLICAQTLGKTVLEGFHFFLSNYLPELCQALPREAREAV